MAAGLLRSLRLFDTCMAQSASLIAPRAADPARLPQGLRQVMLGCSSQTGLH